MYNLSYKWNNNKHRKLIINLQINQLNNQVKCLGLILAKWGIWEKSDEHIVAPNLIDINMVHRRLKILWGRFALSWVTLGNRLQKLLMVLSAQSYCHYVPSTHPSPTLAQFPSSQDPSASSIFYTLFQNCFCFLRVLTMPLLFRAPRGFSLLAAQLWWLTAAFEHASPVTPLSFLLQSHSSMLCERLKEQRKPGLAAYLFVNLEVHPPPR